MDKLDETNNDAGIPAQRSGLSAAMGQAVAAVDSSAPALSQNQLTALKKLAILPCLPETKEELARILGIDKTTWYAWLRERPFRLTINEIAAARVADDALWISEAMACKARGGDVGAARVYFTLTGWDQHRNQRGGGVNVQINFGESG